jgi:hypothetical protein
MIIAPHRVADINGSEVVQTKFKPVGQLLGFESKLKTNAAICEIVNCARMHRFTLDNNPPGVVSSGSLRYSLFHETSHFLTRRPNLMCSPDLQSLLACKRLSGAWSIKEFIGN